jgi:hypothetical protein
MPNDEFILTWKSGAFQRAGGSCSEQTEALALYLSKGENTKANADSSLLVEEKVDSKPGRQAVYCQTRFVVGVATHQ